MAIEVLVVCRGTIWRGKRREEFGGGVRNRRLISVRNFRSAGVRLSTPLAMILSSTRSISAFARASGSFPPRDFPRRADGGRLPPRLIRGGCDTNTLDHNRGPPRPRRASRVSHQS